MTDGEYKLPNGTMLRIFGGGEWACVAHDHGPLCRRCVAIDESLEGLLQNVLDGYLMVKDHPDRGMLFKITPAGERQVRHLLEHGVGE